MRRTTYTHANPDKPPMSRLEEKVRACKNWRQLFRAALTADEANERNSKGVYVSGLRFCSAERLNALLHLVRDGQKPLNVITRNHSLRAKAAELLARDASKSS